jgi:hypothetical protein
MGRSLTLVLAILLAASAAVLAYDRSEFLFLDEIRVGMQGVGKTVVAGDVISDFDVEVLGIIDQPGTLSDFIVVRVSGEAIGRSGGIAQGMSGSPIYIDGKLIGALSRAGAWSKEITPIGLVTPIEPMLAVLDATFDSVAAAPDPVAVLEDVRLVECSRAPAASAVASSPNVIFSYPVATTLVSSGLSGRAANVLMDGEAAAPRPAGTLSDFLPVSALASGVEGLSSLSLSLSPLDMPSGSSAGSTAEASALVPGGSLGIALATGDISLGALGTVTYREGNALVGFGHPFILNGTSGFPLTTVSIYDTMRAYDASYKLGTLGDSVGAILQDRAAAIGGVVGRKADTVDVYYGVQDLDGGDAQTYSMQFVNESRLMPELLLSAGFEAIDTTLGRVGQGTVEVTYQIQGDGLSAPVERHDVFISATDIAIYPPWQLAELVAYLQYNEFQDPQITQIAASMRVTQEIKAIRIEDLTLDSVAYQPGDTIHFTLTLQTYQGKEIVREGSLVIPPDLDADYLFVRAYGGPRLLEGGEAPQVFESLDDIVQAVESLQSYETLTVELFALNPYSPYADAWYGVTSVTEDYPGYVIYDDRQADALLLFANTGGGSEE